MHASATAEDRLFKALADPGRRAILRCLVDGDAPVKDLTARFEMSQPAISQHLAALKEAGLVSGRREGRQVIYRIEPGGMKPLVDWLAQYRTFWIGRIGKLEQLLDEMDP